MPILFGRGQEKKIAATVTELVLNLRGQEKKNSRKQLRNWCD